MRRALPLLVLPFLFTSLSIIVENEPIHKAAPDIFTETNNVDSLLNSLSLDEKIGQIFMIPVTPRDNRSYAETKRALEKYQVGGLIFMKGHPKMQVNWVNTFQKMSKIPLLIAMDAEWGPAMRLDSVIRFPKQMTLGALKDDSLVYRYGRIMGQQLKKLGVNVSFSPVADVNSNPDNPVINVRSFGDDRENVARKCIMYMSGLQDEGVLAVAKHFPGHGDTHVDSHKDLPTIERTQSEMNKVDLYPFKQVFDAGCGGVMSAHIQVPAYDTTKIQPASLSPKITGTLLRETLGFKGLCFSDALSMGGVTNYYKPAEIDIKALMAGNDVLLFPQDIPAAIEAIKVALADSSLSMKTLDEKVRRILQVKQWSAKKATDLDSKTIYETLNTGAFKKLNYELAENSITLLRNEKGFLPLKHQKEKLISLSFHAKNDLFHQALNSYYPTEAINVKEGEKADGLLSKINETSSGTVVISLHWLTSQAVSKNYDLSQDHIDLIEKLILTRNVVLVNFSTPYVLKFFSKPHAVIQAFESLESFNTAAAQIIAGALAPNGVMPCIIPGKYDEGTGLTFRPLDKLKMGLPEQEGLHSEKLFAIDSIVAKAIRAKATPGCQVLIARNNRVVYHKSFGNHTYVEDAIPVKNDHFYDVASVTKIMASTALLMKLYERGDLKLDRTLGYYLKDDVSSDKAKLTIREILAHQSGLAAWIPFYELTLTEQGICDSNYCYAPNTFYSLQVADSLFVNSDVVDTMMKVLNSSKLNKRGEYLYSDLGYFYMKKIIEKLYETDFETALYKEFYEPLGIQARYNPAMTISKKMIVPTEDDTYFRHRLIHGYVHDPAAAMMGGVGGHAGIFSTSWDVAVYMQMLLNGGSYGHEQILKRNTVTTFTTKQFDDNRKGLGFDKPEMDPKKPTPAIRDMSSSAYGHQGFTGTCVWTDPEYQLTYVFLSNRVYPTAENKLLLKMNVRTDILQVIYDDLLNKAP